MIYKTKQNTRFMTKHFLKLNHELRFHKTYVSHRHFYADVPIFTHVSGAVLR
uniref:Uncharacterized protein n=1 Tax=Helianthus annuus TaxID=4232 RepID=A0A251RVJ7_HELAN